MLCFHYLEILNHFIPEFVFHKFNRRREHVHKRMGCISYVGPPLFQLPHLHRQPLMPHKHKSLGTPPRSNESNIFIEFIT